MTFKDVIAQDIHNVFLNSSEFAEIRTVRYDGEEYPDIPVSLQDLEATDRQRLSVSGFGRGRSDGAPGLYQQNCVLFCAASDLGGKVPKRGNTIQISTWEGGTHFRRYSIGLVGNEMGMLRLELEAIGE